MPVDVFVQVLFAAAFHAVWNYAARRVSGNVGVMWFGQVFGCLLCLPAALTYLDTETSLLSLFSFCFLTGLLHAVYFGLLAEAYRHGEISVVYPIARGTGVALTALLAVVLLGEQISFHGLLGILSVCAGILMLGSSLQTYQRANRGLVTAFLTGMAICGYSIVDKRAVGQLHPLVYGCGMWMIAAALYGPFVIVRYPREIRDALKTKKRYIALLAVGPIGTYLIILFAFQRANVAYVAAAREFAVVIGATLGFTLLNEECTSAKLWGIAAITVGLMLIRVA